MLKSQVGQGFYLIFLQIITKTVEIFTQWTLVELTKFSKIFVLVNRCMTELLLLLPLCSWFFKIRMTMALSCFGYFPGNMSIRSTREGRKKVQNQLFCTYK